MSGNDHSRLSHVPYPRACSRAGARTRMCARVIVIFVTLSFPPAHAPAPTHEHAHVLV